MIVGTRAAATSARLLERVFDHAGTHPGRACRANQTAMLTTHTFTFATTAGPARVWMALTDRREIPHYLHGVALVSDWLPASPVELRGWGGAVAYGEVLHAEVNRRLVIALDGGSGPATYLSWEITSTSAGAEVLLAIDEFGDEPDDDTEIVWRPILARLQATLDERNRLPRP
jgi:uncharacterized protein YndB with AHSA1/START domain